MVYVLYVTLFSSSALGLDFKSQVLEKFHCPIRRITKQTAVQEFASRNDVTQKVPRFAIVGQVATPLARDVKLFTSFFVSVQYQYAFIAACAHARSGKPRRSRAYDYYVRQKIFIPLIVFKAAVSFLSEERGVTVT